MCGKSGERAEKRSNISVGRDAEVKVLSIIMVYNYKKSEIFKKSRNFLRKPDDYTNVSSIEAVNCTVQRHGNESFGGFRKF